VFSRNYYSDLWLHLKNKQIFLSLFFVHPKHPFSKVRQLESVHDAFTEGTRIFNSMCYYFFNEVFF